MQHTTPQPRDHDATPYTVGDPLEIAGILGTLRDRHARASIYFNAQPGSMLTSILGVHPATGRFTFDVDADPRRNQALASVPNLAWQTAIDGVKIEFSTTAARTVTHDGAPAFDCALPKSVVRLQRRNAFRAATALTRPVSCLIDVDASARDVKARVLDISALGLSLLIDTNAVAVHELMPLPRVRIDLPGFGEIVCGAEIRYAIDPGKRFAANFRRCGVQFTEMASADQVLIQRYIIALERERAKSRIEV